jgi:hypothetical protein
MTCAASELNPIGSTTKQHLQSVSVAKCYYNSNMSHGVVASEVEVWLAACGLDPKVHGPTLEAAGIYKLIHFKVTPIETMRSALQKTEMKAGDIGLVIAGVHWYLEWRNDRTESKDSFEKHFTESGFEDFVATWNPNQATVTSGTAKGGTTSSSTNPAALVAMVAIVFGFIFK